MKASKPIFIGGTGGSGTRVYTLLVEQGSAFMGPDKNVPQEPRQLLPFTRLFTPRLMAQTRSVDYQVDELPEKLRVAALSELSQFATHVQQCCPAGFKRWGWKHPRNIFFIPLLNHLFSDCHFIHVVRDGRDIALSGNQGQLKTFGPMLLDPPPGDEVWSESVRLWNLVNTTVAELGEALLGCRYIRSKLEDLCADPHGEAKRILDQLDIDSDKAMIAAAAACVDTPSSLGRWRTLPDSKLQVVNEMGAEGLKKFGYLDI